MDRLKIEISWASLWRIVVMIAFVILVYFLRDVVTILFLAIFISTALSSVVVRLERYKIPRILGAIIIFLGVIFLMAFIIYTIVPIAIVQLNSLFANLSDIAEDVLGSDFSLRVRQLINPDLNNLANVLLSGSASLLDIVGRFLGGAAYVLTVLVLAFYLTVSRDGVRDFIKAIFPNKFEDKVVDLYARITRKIGRWFQTQLLLSVIVGVAVFIGLLLLGVKYALVLAIMAAVFELIPVVGPIFAGAIAIMIAATDSMTLGLYVFLLFLLIQQLENNVLVPLMLRKAIDIHPVVILVSILGGIKLAGFVGMLLSVPAAVLGQELINDWMAKKSHDRSEGKTI